MYKSNLKTIKGKMDSGAQQGVLGAASVIANAMRRSLTGSSPSSPGSPPGLRSGRLRNAVAISSLVIGKNPEAFVGLDTAAGGTGRTPPHLYGVFLEYGAAAGRPRPFRLPDGSWRTRKNPMAPRPFFRPLGNDSGVMKAAQDKFAEIASKGLK